MANPTFAFNERGTGRSVCTSVSKHHRAAETCTLISEAMPWLMVRAATRKVSLCAVRCLSTSASELCFPEQFRPAFAECRRRYLRVALVAPPMALSTEGPWLATTSDSSVAETGFLRLLRFLVVTSHFADGVICNGIIMAVGFGCALSPSVLLACSIGAWQLDT